MIVNKLIQFGLRNICRDLVRQSNDHKPLVIEYYKFMREAAQQEFTDDSKFTVDSFLEECFQESLKD
jgi:hypothetical protein